MSNHFISKSNMFMKGLLNDLKTIENQKNKTRITSTKKKVASLKERVHEILIFLSEHQEEYPKQKLKAETENQKHEHTLARRMTYWKKGAKNRIMEKEGMDVRGKYILSEKNQDYIEMAGIELFKNK
jgi:hypothetical protein